MLVMFDGVGGVWRGSRCHVEEVTIVQLFWWKIERDSGSLVKKI